MSSRPDLRRTGAPRRAALAVLLALSFLLLGPVGPARAHTGLSSSNPATGATLTTAPREIVLVFTEDVRPQFTALRLTVGAGPGTPLRPRVSGGTVRALLPRQPDAAATAEWRVAYRVVSADGYPVGGTVIFTVRAPVVPPRTTTPGVLGTREDDGSTSTAGSPAPGPPTPGGTPVSATARIAADAQSGDAGTGTGRRRHVGACPLGGRRSDSSGPGSGAAAPEEKGNRLG